jgi:hypothetical protein
MFTIIWNPHGFYVVDKLLNDTKMNSDYFVTKILGPLKQAIFPGWKAAHQKRLVIHVNNCSVHTSRASTSWLEEYGMCRMLHLPYSPNLISSGFYLFPIVKERIERIQVHQEDQLYESLQEILEGINHD